MTKPKRQAKKPKARTIWVNEDWVGDLRCFDTKAKALAYGRINCIEFRCIEFREVLKKRKK